VIQEIVGAIDSIADAKIRRNFVAAIVEETLTKKPYGKHFAGLLMDSLIPTSFERVKLATECLKNLTSEDFMQLA
jgi:hypothetical protein